MKDWLSQFFTLDSFTFPKHILYANHCAVVLEIETPSPGHDNGEE